MRGDRNPCRCSGLFSFPPSYESQAKLLVRYVLERSAVDPAEAEKAGSSSSNEADRVIGAEIEILTSWDLAMQVAQALGPQRLLPPSGAPATESDAARSIVSGLKVISNKGSNIILISYKNRNPETATLVLQEL